MGHRHVFLVALLALLLVATTHAAITKQGSDGAVGSTTRRRSMIGSAPPSCEGKCGWWCVGTSCAAVLVPIEPPQEQAADKQKQSRRHGSSGGEDDGSRASAAAHLRRRPPSSYDNRDYTNYKPEIWTCKCVGAGRNALMRTTTTQS